MEDLIAIVLIIFIVVALMSAGFYLLYIRHIKSYSDEISTYLKKRNLRLLQQFTPKESDWTNSPFTNPPKVKVSLGTVTVGGIIMPMQDEKYCILKTEENKIIWLKIETTFLYKPKLLFREALDTSNMNTDDLSPTYKDSILTPKKTST